MNSLLLRLKSVEKLDEALPIRWTLDCPARGVVVLDVTVGNGRSDTPLHWRAGDWTKPPLDLRLSRAGSVENIQLVFQDDSVDIGDIALPCEPDIGFPNFDVCLWPKDRFADFRVAVKPRRIPPDVLYIAIGERPIKRSVSIT